MIDNPNSSLFSLSSRGGGGGGEDSFSSPLFVVSTLVSPAKVLVRLSRSFLHRPRFSTPRFPPGRTWNSVGVERARVSRACFAVCVRLPERESRRGSRACDGAPRDGPSGNDHKWKQKERQRERERVRERETKAKIFKDYVALLSASFSSS